MTMVVIVDEIDEVYSSGGRATRMTMATTMMMALSAAANEDADHKKKGE